MNLSVRYLKKTVLVLLLGLLIYFPIFLHLTTLPIRWYDESRLAINAYEMSKSGNFIVTTYKGTPDLWNTKPPLMIWLQAICIKFFGVNELAIRLPAALAALFTCIALLWFSKRFFNQYWLGFISVMVLLTSNGYIEEHVARTGDYDSLLVLLTTCSLFSFFSYTEAESNKQNKWLLIFFILLTLSVLCKGVQGLFFIPAMAIYVLLRKQFVHTMRKRSFYVGILIFIFFIGGYYVLREKMSPGYWAAVRGNELGGRFLEAVEGHLHPFGYYFHNLLDSEFTKWMLLIPCGWAIGLFNSNVLMKRIALFLLLSIMVYFLIISIAQTKVVWYNAPLYPLMAMSVAIFLYWIFELLNRSEHFNSNLVAPITGYILLFLIFVNPYREIYNKVSNPKNSEWNWWWYPIPTYLKHALETDMNLDGSKVLFDGPDATNLFYLKEFEEKNQHLSLAGINDIKSGDRVIISQDKIYDQLLPRYKVDTFALSGLVRVVHLDERK